MLPNHHGPKRSKHHRISENVVTQFGDWEISRMKNKGPSPCVQTNKGKCMPMNVKR